MLSAIFFFSAFSSVVWVFYALSEQNGSINEFTVTTAVVILPIFILWAIFGYIYQYVSASVFNKNMYSLFKQMKKNQDYSDLIAKALLEAEQNLRDNIVLSKFDIFIADMNELLSEIMSRGQLISDEMSDRLWVKVKNGGKWAFGKALIEQNKLRPNLADVLLQKSLQDAVLGGSVLEFCSRYQTLVSSLEKHDKERIFLNVIETGVFGKTFSLLAGSADSIRQNRELVLARTQMADVEDVEISPAKRELLAPQISDPAKRELLAPQISDPEKFESNHSSENGSLSESARRLFINTFTRRKNTASEANKKAEADPLSVAFAKSFGPAEKAVPEQKEETPYFNKDNIETKEEPHVSEYPSVVAEKVEDVSPHFDADEPKEQEISDLKFSMPSYTAPEAPTFDNDLMSTDEPVAPSFGESVTPQLDDRTTSLEKEPDVPSWEIGFSETGKRLEDIRREVESVKMRDLRINGEPEDDEGMPEPKVGNDTDFAYPFGGWTNADNYNK